MFSGFSFVILALFYSLNMCSYYKQQLNDTDSNTLVVPV
jgi:hypothetical protein